MRSWFFLRRKDALFCQEADLYVHNYVGLILDSKQSSEHISRHIYLLNRIESYMACVIQLISKYNAYIYATYACIKFNGTFIELNDTQWWEQSARGSWAFPAVDTISASSVPLFVSLSCLLRSYVTFAIQALYSPHRNPRNTNDFNVYERLALFAIGRQFSTNRPTNTLTRKLARKRLYTHNGTKVKPFSPLVREFIDDSSSFRNSSIVFRYITKSGF